MKKTIQSEILQNTPLTDDIFSMVLDAPHVATHAVPGQFVMAYLDRGEMILPRPISICRTDGDTLTLVYQAVGAGTRYLAGLPPGYALRVTGPLGNGFALPGASGCAVKNTGRYAVVGGGIGTPPLLMLAEALRSRGADVDAFLGFREAPILQVEFEQLGTRTHIAVGAKPTVVDLFATAQTAYDTVFACGPKGMLRALALVCEGRCPLQVSMEERMACGVGTCVGCVTPTQDGYRKVCCQGPVFDATKVDWGVGA